MPSPRPRERSAAHLSRFITIIGKSSGKLRVAAIGLSPRTDTAHDEAPCLLGAKRGHDAWGRTHDGLKAFPRCAPVTGERQSARL